MKPQLIAITGPSGFNKSNLIADIIRLYPDKYAKIMAYTDKPKEDGEDFYFISEEDFTKMIEAEKFLEWQRLLSNNFRYGKTKEDIQKAIAENEGKVIFNHVNIINLPLLKRNYPHIKSIFVDVKDTQSLIDFLKSSPDVTDDEEFERRFKFATEERRRRHLADITIHMRENYDESLKEFIDAVEKIAKS